MQDQWLSNDLNPVIITDKMTTRHLKSLGSVLALLALVMQLGFGAALPRSDVDAVLAATTLCHADDGAPGPAAPHTPDCALCPLCTVGASIVFVAPGTAPSVPAPHTTAIGRAAVPPQSTAPPSRPRFAAQPRAPPFQA